MASKLDALIEALRGKGRDELDEDFLDQIVAERDEDNSVFNAKILEQEELTGSQEKIISDLKSELYDAMRSLSAASPGEESEGESETDTDTDSEESEASKADFSDFLGDEE